MKYIFSRSSMAAMLGMFAFICLTAFTYEVPNPGNDLIGSVQTVESQSGDTLLKIGQRYDSGINEMLEANPGFEPNTVLNTGTQIRVPSSFIIPSLSCRGKIIVNLPEMRLYFSNDNNEIITYPVGIGKIGKTIPITRTAIVRKTKNPTWFPPKDIREWVKKDQGIVLPKKLGPGYDNPLGPYAIYLKIPTFLIHSTIFPESIGKRASFGCIRMYENDIKELYSLVKSGMPVIIIDMPVKVGWQGNKVYLETHPPLEERSNALGATLAGVKQAIQQNIPRGQTVLIDWQLVSFLMKNPDGIPHEIGISVARHS